MFGGAKLAFHLAPGFARLGHMGMPASNNWVVDGTRTISGKPMLASDPHLPQSMPSIWYEAVLVTPTASRRARWLRVRRRLRSAPTVTSRGA